jgi:hypothetical protein
MSTFYDPSQAHIGNDDPLHGVALVITEDGRSIMEPIMPKAVERATAEQQTLIADLQGPVRVIMLAVQDLDAAVFAAREGGLSWQTIGWCVGTSAQAARQRWSDRA